MYAIVEDKRTIFVGRKMNTTSAIMEHFTQSSRADSFRVLRPWPNIPLHHMVGMHGGCGVYFLKFDPTRLWGTGTWPCFSAGGTTPVIFNQIASQLANPNPLSDRPARQLFVISSTSSRRSSPIP
jgi:hypothetical protein